MSRDIYLSPTRRVFILSEDLEEKDQSETSIMKLAYAENNIIADKKRRNFFKNFYIVLPRSTHQEASIELSFVLFGSVGASEKNLHSEKKLVIIDFRIRLKNTLVNNFKNVGTVDKCIPRKKKF